MRVESSALSLRDQLAYELVEMSKNNDNIVVLDADLSAASGMSYFSKHRPHRFINCGIQEANMIGVAGGLSSMGFIPFTHSFAAFASRRVADQAFASCLYSKQNVKMIGSDPGILNSANGGTHLAYEDLGIFMSFPEINIVDFTDATMIKGLLPQIINTKGSFYLRLYRKTNNKIYKDNETFKLGKAKVLQRGKDITLFAAGALSVPDALVTAGLLLDFGYSATVIDLVSIKPLDKDLIIDEARRTGLVAIFDNHNVVNGIGTNIVGLLSESNVFIPSIKIGVPDCFGEVGTIDYLKEKYDMLPRQVCLKLVEKLRVCRGQ